MSLITCLLYLLRKCTLLICCQSTVIWNLFPLSQVPGTEHQLWTSKSVMCMSLKFIYDFGSLLEMLLELSYLQLSFRRPGNLGLTFCQKTIIFPLPPSSFAEAAWLAVQMSLVPQGASDLWMSQNSLLFSTAIR